MAYQQPPYGQPSHHGQHPSSPYPSGPPYPAGSPYPPQSPNPSAPPGGGTMTVYPQSGYPQSGYPTTTAGLQPFYAQYPSAPAYGQQPYGTPQASPYGVPPLPYGAAPSPYAPAPMQPSHHPGTAPASPYMQQGYGTSLPPSPYLSSGAFQPTPPSVGYGPSLPIQWDPRDDARALRQAMRGLGTNEKELIRVLAHKDPLQINALRQCYTDELRRDLVTDLRKETSGWFEYGLVAVARGPLLNDAYMVFDAVDGAGTNEMLLNDVLVGRSNADLNAIKAMYPAVTNGRDLATDVLGDLSMKTKRHFKMILAARRAEDTEPVDYARVEIDVDTLYTATEGQIGTDEIKVAEILSYRNDAQIWAISQSYMNRYRRPLSDVFDKEFSGHMRSTLLFQLRHAEDRHLHAAELLEEAMVGLGTKDKLLVSRVVRFHWNRGDIDIIKEKFREMRQGTLAMRIINETSRDQRRLLLALIREPWS